MAEINTYDDLSQKTEEILNKDYLFRIAGFSLLASNGKFDVRFKGKANTDSKFKGSVGWKYSHKYFSIQDERNTLNNAKYNLSITPPLSDQNLKLGLECKVNNQADRISSKVSAEYTRKQDFTSNFNFLTENNTGRLNFTYNINQYTLGAEIKACPEGVVHIGSALALRSEDLDLVFKHETSELALGNLWIYFNHRLSPYLSLVSSISANLKSKSNTIQVGCLYKLDSAHTIKAKVEHEGNMALAFIKRFDKNYFMSCSAGFNLHDLNTGGINNHRLGFRLGYNSKGLD